MSDMAQERIDAYLDEQDAAAEWTPVRYHAPSFDEWNAIRANVGLPAADFWAYIEAIDQRGRQCSHDTLAYFGAIDDDDIIPDGGEVKS